MKTKILLLMFVLTVGTLSVNAQKKVTKVAVINTQEILQLMPEYDSASTAMQKKYAEMEQQLQMMMEELQGKQTALEQQKDSLTPMWRSMRVQEIKDLQSRIQQFQSGAQQELTDYQNKLIAVILKKIQAVVKEVAKENGYTHVIDNSSQVVLYFDESYDITNLVKTKLKLKDKPLPTGGAGGM
jgi:outer membrane protein